MNSAQKVIGFTIIMIAILAGCSTIKSNPPTETIASTDITNITAIPTTTEEPHIELTREVIFQMLDEATALLNENKRIVLDANQYTERFIVSMNLNSAEEITLSDGIITIQNAKSSSIFNELRFVILLTSLMEQYPDAYTDDNIRGDYLPSTIYALSFYSEYASAGYDNVYAFVSDKYVSQLPGTSHFRIYYDGIYVIDEWPRYFEGETNRHAKIPLYSYLNTTDEYYKYLQSKGEG